MPTSIRSCALLAIGTEVTRGDIVNSNTAYMAQTLTNWGFDVTIHLCVKDTKQAITQALSILEQSCDCIITTGGLGPTSDDLTASAIASWLGTTTLFNQEAYAITERRLKTLGIQEPSDIQKKQAYLPQSATVLDNTQGTAAGFYIIKKQPQKNMHIFSLPGVPHEMKAMLENQVWPYLKPLCQRIYTCLKYMTYGSYEASLSALLKDFEAQYKNQVSIAYRVCFPEIEIKLIAEQTSYLEAADKELKTILKGIIYSQTNQTYIEHTIELLRQKKLTLSIAESCTGGLLAHLLTSYPVSDILLADTVVYHNHAKHLFLDIEETLIQTYGAVSEEVALAMAQAISRKTQSNIGIGITGIAGPSGGSSKKPVGLVYVAIVLQTPHQNNQQSLVYPLNIKGDRARIQKQAAYQALFYMNQIISAMP